MLEQIFTTVPVFKWCNHFKLIIGIATVTYSLH